jgi:copper(I)-binding protein
MLTIVRCLVFMGALFIVPFSLAASLLQVSEATIREAPPGITVNAGYARLNNTNSHDITINAVSSDSFESISIHLTQVDGGVAKMIPQAELRVPAGQSIELKPGSYHLMLLNASHMITAGDSIEIIFHTSGGDVRSEFRIKRF